MKTHAWRCFALALSCLATAGYAQTHKTFLPTNGVLGVNEILTSPNGKVYATMQKDGNLCVYDGTPSAQKGNVWCTMKHGAHAQYFTVVQGDGNLCTYQGTGPAANKGGWWCSSKTGAPGNYYLVMQDDANLCVHKGTYPNSQGAVWCHDKGIIPSKLTLGKGVKGVMFKNLTPYAVWVTRYRNDGIEGVGCLAAGGTADVRFERNNWLRIRAEVTTTRNCAHPLVCDVSVNLRAEDLKLWSEGNRQYIHNTYAVRTSPKCEVGSGG